VLQNRILHFIALILLSGFSLSCAIKERAINSAAQVFSNAQQVYLSDGDPELVEAALPFNLKTLEVLLESYPEHQGILLSTSTSFTLYAFAFVEPRADAAEDDDFFLAQRLWARASALYRRGRDYGLRALEVTHPGISEKLSQNPESAVSGLTIQDLDATVWTAAAWGAAISTAKDDPEMTADIAVVGGLLHKALELDENFADGFIHELLMSYELGRFGGSHEQAKHHYERALELSKGKKVSVWLNWAIQACVASQDRQQFNSLLDKVLEFNLEEAPSNRLLNTLAQRKAALLKTRVDDLFLEGGIP